MQLAMPVVSTDRLSLHEVRFLIESGAFTAEEWADTSVSVDRGRLQLGTVEWWLMGLLATKSLEDVAGLLGWDEEAVRVAVSGGACTQSRFRTDFAFLLGSSKLPRPRSSYLASPASSMPSPLDGTGAVLPDS